MKALDELRLEVKWISSEGGVLPPGSEMPDACKETIKRSLSWLDARGVLHLV